MTPKTKKMPQNRHKTGFRGPSSDVGRDTQFKPGQSGNPGGRPKKTPYTDAHRLIAEMIGVADLNILPTDTIAECVAKIMAARNRLFQHST